MEDYQPFEEKKSKARQDNELQRKQQLADVEEILATAAGRRFVWRLLSISGIYRNSFTGDSRTFFREGERNVGLQIMRDVMMADPDALSRMQREAKESGHAERDRTKRGTE